MWKYNNTDELYHYGILGMKWGKRRYQNKDGSLTPEGKLKEERDSADYKLASELKKKKISEMSNAELRKYNERVQLERQYSQLNPKAIKQGLAFVIATAGAMGSILSLYDNSNRIIKAGKTIYESMNPRQMRFKV